jgi:hypothetical protein
LLLYVVCPFCALVRQQHQIIVNYINWPRSTQQDTVEADDGERFTKELTRKLENCDRLFVSHHLHLVSWLALALLLARLASAIVSFSIESHFAIKCQSRECYNSPLDSKQFDVVIILVFCGRRWDGIVSRIENSEHGWTFKSTASEKERLLLY